MSHFVAGGRDGVLRPAKSLGGGGGGPLWYETRAKGQGQRRFRREMLACLCINIAGVAGRFSCSSGCWLRRSRICGGSSLAPARCEGSTASCHRSSSARSLRGRRKTGCISDGTSWICSLRCWLEGSLSRLDVWETWSKGDDGVWCTLFLHEADDSQYIQILPPFTCRLGLARHNEIFVH